MFIAQYTHARMHARTHTHTQFYIQRFPTYYYQHFNFVCAQIWQLCIKLNSSTAQLIYLLLLKESLVMTELIYFIFRSKHIVC